ncbi:MAG: 3-hydroxyacyl-CoA dehydrogenase NAD-binding domain-containing protein [Gammaproteobacteria bacterium]
MANADAITYEIDGDLGIVTANNPPVNALSHFVRSGLVDVLRDAESDSTKVTIVVCAGRTFFAGADITEFGKPPQPPAFQELMQVIEDHPKPVIAAIHGTALGGGLELAMSCHYRLAVPSTRVGLPEVHLGILPGAGGTQRLPRLIGPQAALDAITSGRHIGAAEALELGIIDEITPPDDLIGSAKRYAEKVINEGCQIRKVSELDDKVANVDLSIFEAAREKMAKQKRGYEAPQRCIDCVEAACTKPFEEGLAVERELIAGLMGGNQSIAQRHIFFAERAAAKVDDMPKDTQIQPINSVAIIGAGTMGGGIAMNFINAGIPVTLLETKQELLDKGLAIVRGNYERSAKKGRFSMEEVDKRMGLIKPSLNYADIADVDMVIEAVFENMAIKKTVFEKLDEVTKDACILATNTSTLDVNEIAAVTKRPGKVIGLHFFSPANVMRLLEIVRADQTSFETLATSQAIGKKIGKVGVVVGVCDGFVGNRMLHKYLEQGQYLLEEGALPHEVDSAIYDLGLAMGPFAMGDLTGLDVGWRIRQERGVPASLPEGARYCAIGDEICEMGRYGQKTGAGYYKYEQGDRTPHRDPIIEDLIKDYSARHGIKRRAIDDNEIVERMIYALVNEGAKILEEGIAQRASDIDLIYVNGYGFPASLGGPMRYADAIGLDKVYKRICDFAEQDSDSWQPAAMLKSLAEQGAEFNA